MTRLDAASEPSMEDILASIRKIIAEDPPGSRATPAPAPNLGRPIAQAQQPLDPAALRGASRDTFFPPATEPAVSEPAAAPAPEPYLRAEPQKPSSAAFDAEGFFAKSPSSVSSSKLQAKPFVPDAPSARVEPSFAPMAQRIATPEAAAAAFSVDAQLSDLLGDALPAGAAETAAPSALQDMAVPTTSSHFAEVAPSRAELMPSPAPAPIADVRHELRQGFTVSRDGFVPEQVAAKPTIERDPFDFDLGPSPFEAKTTAAHTTKSSSVQLAGFERVSSLDLGDVVPGRSVEKPLSDTAASMSSEPVGVVSKAAAPDAGTTPSFEPYAATSETPAIVSAAPSVAATIAPEAVVPSRSSEPIARFVPANASVDGPKSIARDVMEVVSQESQIEVHSPAETFDGNAISGTVAASAGVSMTEVGAQQRTMEETVADLLRPMLRTWLAENMPRIVERALRRELTEQLGGDKQEAAE